MDEPPFFSGAKTQQLLHGQADLAKQVLLLLQANMSAQAEGRAPPGLATKSGLMSS
jgi:hypothetical protein